MNNQPTPPIAQNRATMNNTAQAFSSKKRNVAIPKDVKRQIVKAAIRQTHVQETEAGREAKRVADATTLTGIPKVLAQKAVDKSAAGLKNSTAFIDIENILKKNGTFQGTIVNKYSPSLSRVDLGKQGHALLVNINSAASQNQLYNVIDQFAASKHNIKNLTSMSVTSLTALKNNAGTNDDIKSLIDHVIALKRGTLDNNSITSRFEDIERILNKNAYDEIYQNIDQFASQYNINNLSSMSVTQLRKLKANSNLSPDMQSAIDDVIALKNGDLNHVSSNFINSHSTFRGKIINKGSPASMNRLKGGKYNDTLLVDIMDERSVAQLLNEINKYAENHNISNLTTMSLSKLRDLKNNTSDADLKTIIDHVITLKQHDNNLASLRMSKNKFSRVLKNKIRQNTQDLDAANSAMLMVDTVDSVKRTIKTVKLIKSKASAYSRNHANGPAAGTQNTANAPGSSGNRANNGSAQTQRSTTTRTTTNSKNANSGNSKTPTNTKSSNANKPTSTKRTKHQRMCRVCGRPLPVRSPFGMCQTCKDGTTKRILQKMRLSKGKTASTVGNTGKAAGTFSTSGGTIAAKGAAVGASGTGAVGTVAGTSAGMAAGTSTGAAAGATVGTSTGAAAGATAGAVGGSAVLIVCGIVLLVVMLALIIIMFFVGLSNVIPNFYTTEDGKSYESVFQTEGGKLYTKLREKDALFIDSINNYKKKNSPADVTGDTVHGYWNHEENGTNIIDDWSRASTKWLNGEGERLESFSNTKGIMAAATVLTDSDFEKLLKTFEKYSLQLWEDTHHYTVSTSGVYACTKGCAKQTYHCNDSQFYDHIDDMVIIKGGDVPYSTMGCRVCQFTYCSGCVSYYCDGYHNAAPCTGHLLCLGHLHDQYGNRCTGTQSYTAKTYAFACDGCVTTTEELDEPDENGETTKTTVSCPKDGYHIVYVSEPVCPGHCDGHDVTLCLGHIDLTITVTVNNVQDEANSLFDVDTIGKEKGKNLSIVTEPKKEKYDWEDGWTEENKDRAIMFEEDDWYYLYDIGASDSETYFYLNVSEEVLAYRPTIEQYAELHGVPDYVELIMAIMMQESGGLGDDPMQASECGYNTQYPQEPNGITDPEYSINVGIRYFADCLSAAGVADPSDMDRIKLALQGYNYGTGYISWAIENHGGYTLENASEFSDIQASALGWNAYGDKQYVPHVLRYYILSKGNQDIVEVALSQVGNVGGEPFWSWYGYESRVPWCACFVSWCADRCGYLESGAMEKFSYCPTGIDWFQGKGQWKSSDYAPVAGDIIFFDWEGDGVSDHVGIVSKTVDGIVFTVEGNSGDACKEKQYAVGSDCIVGYGIPAYPAGENSSPDSTE